MILIKSPSKKLTIKLMTISLIMMLSIPLTHFDISYFFEDPSEKIDHLIGNGNVCYD